MKVVISNKKRFTLKHKASLLTMMIAGAMVHTNVNAATYFCGSGDTNCLIRSMDAANATLGNDVIRLAAGRFVFTKAHNNTSLATDSALYVNSDEIKIIGKSAGETIIERDKTTNEGDFRLFKVNRAGHLKLNKLTVSEGVAGLGGAMYNDGKLTLFDVVVRQSSARYGSGGGIANFGKLTVNKSIFRKNFADFGGGAITNGGGAYIADSRFLLNDGSTEAGAIQNGGTLTLLRSYVASNRLSVFHQVGGAGISNTGGKLKVLKSTIEKNTAGYAFGVGVYNNNGEVEIRDSVIVKNSQGGGSGVGVYSGRNIDYTNTGSSSKLRIFSSTIASNRTQDSGSGVGVMVDAGSAVLKNVTIAYNDNDGIVEGSAGLAVLPGANVVVRNSLIDRNQQAVSREYGRDCSGRVVSRGYNLLGTVAGCQFVKTNTDKLNQAARIGSLRDSTTPGKTYVPLAAGSPAIDAIPRTLCSYRDQLQRNRRDGNADGVIACDMGSVEK